MSYTHIYFEASRARDEQLRRDAGLQRLAASTRPAKAAKPKAEAEAPRRRALGWRLRRPSRAAV